MGLKDCPFCGSNDLFADYNSSGYCVICNHCEAEGPLESTSEEANAAWNERHRSWNLLMEWIDEIYPAHIFDGSSGDIGPQILVKLREINELRKGE